MSKYTDGLPKTGPYTPMDIAPGEFAREETPMASKDTWGLEDLMLEAFSKLTSADKTVLVKYARRREENAYKTGKQEAEADVNARIREVLEGIKIMPHSHYGPGCLVCRTIDQHLNGSKEYGIAALPKQEGQE